MTDGARPGPAIGFRVLRLAAEPVRTGSLVDVRRL